MIDEINVQNLALIREATLIPSRGLTVLTGETGAGKTALLSALKLLMGARASADLVRDGERGLQVSGRFFGLPVPGADPSGSGVLAVTPDGNDGPAGNAAGMETSADADVNAPADSDDETVVVRRVGADGRSRASVDGSMASVRELAGLVAPSIDLCGQFEHQQLMRTSTHVSMLDAWAGGEVKAAREAYARAFDEASAAEARLQRVLDAQESSSAQLDQARFDLRRIDEVNPREGEYDTLQHDLELAEHAESLATAVETAHAALADDAGALDALYTAASALEAVGRVDADLTALAASLREAGYVLEDVSAQVRDYRDKVEFDPAQLAEQQERFAQLQGLLRTYGPSMDDVFERRRQAEQLVALATDSGERLRQAQEDLDRAQETLSAAADELDAAREQAAPRFSEEVTRVMGRLQMQGAQLVCAQERLARSAWTKAGPSSFEFRYRPASGMQPRPLTRIASGGEVSRVMLAIKVVLGSHDDVATLVFDEVDAGVGGAVAVSLAEEIARLAQTHQVIVVTHLAQVAVRADEQYVVRREGSETQLVHVHGEDREREIARMLSGSITEASLTHARELLGNAEFEPLA